MAILSGLLTRKIKYFVREIESGKWGVFKQGNQRATKTFPTRELAEKFATGQAKKNGGKVVKEK